MERTTDNFQCVWVFEFFFVNLFVLRFGITNDVYSGGLHHHYITEK